VIDFAGHDEIVLVQSLDLFGAQRDGLVTPAETDVGMMSFGFGKLADRLHKGHRDNTHQRWWADRVEVRRSVLLKTLNENRAAYPFLTLRACGPVV
jgi:hypothetical protein